jgi:hypothetical protein
MFELDDSAAPNPALDAFLAHADGAKYAGQAVENIAGMRACCDQS